MRPEAPNLLAFQAQKGSGIILLMSLGSSTSVTEFAVEQDRRSIGEPPRILVIGQDGEFADWTAHCVRSSDPRFPVAVKQRTVTYTEWSEADREPGSLATFDTALMPADSEAMAALGFPEKNR